MQTKGGMATGNIRAAAAGGGLVDSFMAIGRQEGVRGYWRGNIPQASRRWCTLAPTASSLLLSLPIAELIQFYRLD